MSAVSSATGGVVLYKKSDFSYALPQDQIAQQPANPRGSSRLLEVCLDGSNHHRQFRDVIDLLPPKAVVVVNNSQVIPARALGYKKTGGKIEIFFLRCLSHQAEIQADTSEDEDQLWECMIRGKKKLKLGDIIQLYAPSSQPEEVPEAVQERERDNRSHDVEITGWLPEGLVQVRYRGDVLSMLSEVGQVPLPPYIQRSAGAKDATSYQTVFAEVPGAVAAPTAGLHFTEDVVSALRASGRDLVSIRLDVGLGTFAPMRTSDIEAHKMHSERYFIPEKTARLVASGRPVVAIGTTVVRTLESAAISTSSDNKRVQVGEGETQLFIRPGYSFRIVDHLLTNFHLPESTLLMMVCAFSGYHRVMAAYQCAVDKGYRFFSYGDCMLLSHAKGEKEAKV